MIDKATAVCLMVGVIGVLGCVAKKEMAPNTINPLDSYERDRDGTGSLFKGDAGVLSDEAIAKILASPLALGGKNRLAVLKLGNAKYWSEEHAQAEQQNAVSLLNRLRSAPTVAFAGELPKLLVPEKTTVPFLREAAARYRADILLVYDTGVRTFTKYRTLGKDEVRALCTVEAVLVDVRTGLVPFTARRVEEVSAARSKDDLDFSETIAKTISSAEGKALDAIAVETVAFLSDPR